jgi:hypothetical protein
MAVVARPACIWLVFMPDHRCMLDRDASHVVTDNPALPQWLVGAWQNKVQRISVDLRSMLEYAIERYR